VTMWKAVNRPRCSTSSKRPTTSLWPRQVTLAISSRSAPGPGAEKDRIAICVRRGGTAGSRRFGAAGCSPKQDIADALREPGGAAPRSTLAPIARRLNASQSARSCVAAVDGPEQAGRGPDPDYVHRCLRELGISGPPC
jgi:hypothetical protein